MLQKCKKDEFLKEIGVLKAKIADLEMKNRKLEDKINNLENMIHNIFMKTQGGC